MPEFQIVADFKLTGDQPQAVDRLVENVERGIVHQTLVGVTGSGKTFTMANVVERVQRPTLVIVHNKTLAAQLATEFKEFFPNNAVEYFVSYYNYYQPEAYIPRTDLYIEKDADVNEELDKLRHAATRALLTRRDVLIVASVSCIFGLGSPEEYQSFVAYIRKGETRSPAKLARQLIDMQYERNDFDLSRGRFRIRGDTMEILPAYEEVGVRIEFWGDEVERIIQLDPLTGELLAECDDIEIYPAKHFVTPQDKLLDALVRIESELEEQLEIFRGQGKLLEAQRLESRTNYDLEMMRETGYCAGVENYSRPISGREPGSAPYTLLDYFPEDYLLFIDESHMTLPQIRAMHGGDRSRKEVLVEYGFRLPSALDNRPLNFGEFEERVNQVVYVSATPGPHEYGIDALTDLLIEKVKKGKHCLVTLPTQDVGNLLAEYLKRQMYVRHGRNVKIEFLPTAIGASHRSQLLHDLELGLFEVLIGVDVLHNIRDVPEVDVILVSDNLEAIEDGFRSIAQYHDKGERCLVTTPIISITEYLHNFLSNMGMEVHNLDPERGESGRNNGLDGSRDGINQLVLGTNLLSKESMLQSNGDNPVEMGLIIAYDDRQSVEQVIRPTGLIDPLIEVKPTEGQIDDLLFQIGSRVDKGQRTIVTTLTKRMAEELADYLREMGIRTHYLHSEIDTLERSEILRDLRLGVYDVIVGINLMREGLDLPEVSLVAILDADKEGYLRSTTALIQTTGRAARHIEGHVIMYADRVTDSMKRAIDETERRRAIQDSYNRENGITPQGIQKSVHDITERVKAVAETRATYMVDQGDMPKDDILRLIKDLESQMKMAARNLEFEKAALLRDQITDLRKVVVE